MILLLFILVLKAILGVFFVLYGDIYLSPDEAQYWLWSRFLDFGYYSKPPAITWEIALGTSILGSTEIGVRIGAIVLSFFIGISTFYLAKACDLSERRSKYSALMVALCPIGLLGSFFATTDLGFVLFWILAFTLIAFALKDDKPPSFVLLGFFILLGALFKWPMFLIFFPLTVGFFYYPLLKTKKIFITLAISLCALVPSIYWNINHEFATFKHVFRQSLSFSNPNPFYFITAQILLFFPSFFIFFLIAVYRLPKLTKPLRFVTTWAAIFFLGYFALAFYQEMLSNWLVFAYPLAAVAAGHLISKRWMIISLIVSTVSSIGILFLPMLQKNTLLIPYKDNPFEFCLGWPSLKDALKISGYDPNKEVLISDTYQMCSLLSFYSEGQKRSYLLNLKQNKKNQFFFWPQLEKGSSGYFVISDSGSLENSEALKEKYLKVLKPYFEIVEKADFYPLFSSKDIPLKWALVFKVKEYTGLKPIETFEY